jgi:small subunit ribosomal protein S6
MAQVSPTYDLVLLLDPQAQESARAKILADARQAIAAKGEIVRDDDWGDRALAYPIQRKADAEYHLLQFKTRAPEMLSEMSRTLHITDGILRFRIVKLKPGTPDAPDMRSGSHSARPADAHGHGAGTGRPSGPARATGAEASPPSDAAPTADAAATAETAPTSDAPATAETAPTSDAPATAETAPTSDAPATAETAPTSDAAPDEATPAAQSEATTEAAPATEEPAPDQPPAD